MSGIWYFVGSAQVFCVIFLRDWSVFVIDSNSKYRSPGRVRMIFVALVSRSFSEIGLLCVDNSVAYSSWSKHCVSRVSRGFRRFWDVADSQFFE